MREEGREVALGVGPSRVGPVYRPCPASGLVDDKNSAVNETVRTRMQRLRQPRCLLA